MSVRSKSKAPETAPKQNDQIWKELEEKLPWRTTSSDQQKRDQIWSLFDMNGNGYLSLAEVDKGMRDAVQLPLLFEAKPVLMRAFMAAKSIAKSKSPHGDDYITKGEEFRYMFKFLRQYYEFFVAFKKVDTGMDQRVDKQEFIQATAMLQKWGIDTGNMEQQWKQVDRDGKGQVLFIEFVGWAFNKKLDLDDDDNMDDFESPQQPVATQKSVKQVPQNLDTQRKSQTNVQKVGSQKSSSTDYIWKQLKEKLPWGNTPEQNAQREQYWTGFDVNGNGYISLAEVDKGIRDVLFIPELFATKPVLMRAFMAAKQISPSKTSHSNDYITKGEEFRFLFKFLRQYYEFFIAFNKIDNGQDQRVDKKEFLSAAPLLQKWGIDTTNMDQQWKEADKDGKGQVLFIEFVNWAFTKKLDLDEDDDADNFDTVPEVQNNSKPTISKKNSNVVSQIRKSGVQPTKSDDIWKTLEEKLPWRNTPEHKAKRDQYWQGFDVNGNGYLSLAEIDKGITDVVQLPVLFAAKPVLMRAYMAAKAISKAKNQHSNDYITKGEEFRYLFKFLRQYYEFFIAFNKIDNGQDQRVDKQEFLKAAPMLQKWGIDIGNMEQQWKEADKDGKGQVLFIEFVNWAFNKQLDLDDDDDADDFEAAPKSQTSGKQAISNRNSTNVSQTKKLAPAAGQYDDIWKTLEEKLPWRNTPEHKAKRDQYWQGFDVNGNGYLSLAEIDKGITDVVQLPVLFAAKPVLMRAYMAAKAISKAKTQHSNDYITKGEEFRYLFKFLRQYFEFFIAFNKIDNGQDQRVDKQEFIQAAPLLKKWGIDTSNMDQQWKEADKDGKGQVLFIEFVDWAFNKKLDLDDDDDADDFEAPPPKQGAFKKTGKQSVNKGDSQRQSQISLSKVSQPASQSQDNIWQTLEIKLPWRNSAEHKAKREKYWSGFDVNGNGYLSLAEIDKGMRDVVQLPNLFAAKPVLMRAYMAAKNKQKAKTAHSDDYITKGEEFRVLFQYLRQYYEFFVAFNKIDNGQDQRIDKSEFVKAEPMLKRWGIDTSNMDQQWREADKDGKGQVLFIEFVDWAFNQQLDLDDDDDGDNGAYEPPASQKALLPQQIQRQTSKQTAVQKQKQEPVVEQEQDPRDVNRLINVWLFKLQLVLPSEESKEKLKILSQCEYTVKAVFKNIREGKIVTVQTPANRFSFITVNEFQKCVHEVQQKTGLDLSGFSYFFEKKVPQGEIHFCHLLLGRTTFDETDFFKLVVDWIVHQSVQESSNPKELISLLPVTERGGIYFFLPPDQFPSSRVKQVEEEQPGDDPKKIELALIEIFNYYTRRYIDKPTDFEQMHTNLFNLGLRGYIAFLNDMQIPVDKQRATEVWKKTAKNNQPHQFEDFYECLQKTAVASLRYLEEGAKKKLEKLKQVMDHLSKGQKLPIHLYHFEQMPSLEIQRMQRQLRADIKEWSLMSDEQAFSKLLNESIKYKTPHLYQARLPGYKIEIKLAEHNQKMAKKILKVKQNNEENMQSLGGRSGISSMLGRATIIPPMKAKDQQNSVARLYQRAFAVSQSDTANSTANDQTSSQFQSNYKLKQVQTRLRDQSYQPVGDSTSRLSHGTADLDEQRSSQGQSSKLVSPRVKRNFILEKKLVLKAAPEPSPEQVLSEKLQALTFEDINKMHYSKLNQADNKADHFDPKQLIDLDSDDYEDQEEEVKAIIKSPTRRSQPVKSIIKQSPKAKSIQKSQPTKVVEKFTPYSENEVGSSRQIRTIEKPQQSHLSHFTEMTPRGPPQGIQAPHLGHYANQTNKTVQPMTLLQQQQQFQMHQSSNVSIQKNNASYNQQLNQQQRRLSNQLPPIRQAQAQDQFPAAIFNNQSQRKQSVLPTLQRNSVGALAQLPKNR